MLSKSARRLTIGHVFRRVRSDVRTLMGQRWFRAGLLVRLLAVLLLVPDVRRQWFLPFLASTRTLDPYSAWMDAGGDPLAWPYGPVMTLAHLPTIVSAWLGAPLWVASAVFGLTLLCADLATLVALRRLALAGTRTVASQLWWWSPASLAITYWHGQTDLVPLALLMASLAAFQSRRWRAAGLLVGLSIGAKFSMLVAPPFFLLWLGLSRRNWRRILLSGVPMLVVPALCVGVAALSPGAVRMVFGSPLVAQVTRASFEINGVPILLLPGALLCLLFTSARMKRQSFQLMLGLLGSAFIMMAAVVAVAPGWWLWALPFLTLYASNSRRQEVLWAIWTFAGMLCVHTFLTAQGSHLAFMPLPAIEVSLFVASITVTSVLAVGLMLLLVQFRSTLRHNDPYGLAIRPLVIGIAGDSGTGKDTLSTALARVFGENEVVAVSGDDYHAWERGSPMWKVWTHLNPAANQLALLADDLRTLVHGGAIQCRSYDHGTGRFDPRRRKKHNDVVLVSGLHTLHSAELRDTQDVRIYLDMSEPLRRHLKIMRDTHARNHSLEKVLASIERRMPDYHAFISPQKHHADLVFRLEQAEGIDLDKCGPGQNIPLRLEATSRRGQKFDELARLLTSFCWCDIQVSQGQAGETVLVYEGGDLQEDDVAEIVSLLIADYEELVAMEPRFEGGVTGMMQLLVLLQIETSRRNSPFAAHRSEAELG